MTDVFHEVRFPDDIAVGATGGPMFKTTLLELANGFEKANIDWSLAKGKWDVAQGFRSRADLDVSRGFFYARYGRSYPFRFKDWGDYQIIAQSIGVGDGATTVFQIFKSYSSGGYDYLRPIKKIVAATYVVKVDGVVLVEGAGAGKFQIDITTGRITFGTAPASSKDVTISCEFDVPVRFDTDHFDPTLIQAKPDGSALGSWQNVPIVEKRL